ncbi:integrase catalytic domain-containing protein [Trichonephila clavipes]|nr:integrase catalytic domain-containing protein [Trichonephila clavipes]
MSFTRRPGSGRLQQTSRREDRHICCGARGNWTAPEWNQVIFSNESRFNLSSDDNHIRVWRPHGERLNPAFALQRHTTATFAVMPSSMSMTFFDPHVLPLIQRLPGAIFQLDNARPHTARLSQDSLRTLTTLPRPARSPDLSPIEHIWDHLGRRVGQPTSLNDYSKYRTKCLKTSYRTYKHQRKGTYQKIYVAIFVCLSSKAVHLEIVSYLTTDAFLAILKRFVARREKCATISSDNAKNFAGANRELKRLHNLLKCPEEKLSSYLSSEGISWNFMPPRAPNFGGLWEAGVKSFKFHLKRAVRNLKTTLEEFLTIITQIEGILNSRPITPLSEDIDDLEALTPGHFLIGRPITSISEPNLLDKTENTLSWWQKLTKIVQHIWTKWSRDYLNNLQQRNKWQFHKDNVKLNTMFLIKEDNLPVNKWSLGHITKLFPGTDGKVRVVEINTNKGNIKRSIGKVCVLPLDN